MRLGKEVLQKGKSRAGQYDPRGWTGYECDYLDSEYELHKPVAPRIGSSVTLGENANGPVIASEI
jgi:hypothetical protein